MSIPDEAIRAAALVLSCVEDQYDEDDWNVAHDVLHAAAPLIAAPAAAAERVSIIAFLEGEAAECRRYPQGYSQDAANVLEQHAGMLRQP